MKLENISPNDVALVYLSKDELLILNNALNEVCHGVKIPAFSTRLGATHEEVKGLLEQISATIDRLDELHLDRKKVETVVHTYPNGESPARRKRIK